MLAVMAAVFRPWVRNRKTGKSVRAKNYVVQFRHPATGQRTRHYLKTPLKKVAEMKAAKLMERLELEAIGVLPPQSDAIGKSLTDLLTEFISVFRSRGLTHDYVRLVQFRLNRLLAITGWKAPGDISGRSMERALASLREKGTHPSTANAYLSHARTWTEWMRLPLEPLRGVQPLPTKGIEKRKRRALTDDEAVRLLTATLASTQKVEGYTGEERYWAYQLALATGLRANEIRSITPESFNWQANTVRVLCGAAKNRREAIQPLPLALVPSIRPFVAGRPPGPIWKRMKDACFFLGHDLAVADVPYKLGLEYADFHALRYTYATRLAKAGVLPAIAQRLLRHSDANLTMGLYTHLTSAELRHAIDSLPQYAPHHAPCTHPETASSVQNGTVRKPRHLRPTNSFRRKRT